MEHQNEPTVTAESARCQLHQKRLGHKAMERTIQRCSQAAIGQQVDNNFHQLAREGDPHPVGNVGFRSMF
jgi:hypothetical protein